MSALREIGLWKEAIGESTASRIRRCVTEDPQRCCDHSKRWRYAERTPGVKPLVGQRSIPSKTLAKQCYNGDLTC